MQKREVSMLKSLLVAAILCSFAVLWSGIEVVVLADDDLVANTLDVPKDDASSVAYSRQIYKVPEVRLEPSDMAVPEDWNEELLRRLNYAYVEYDTLSIDCTGACGRFPQSVLNDFYDEKYDEIIEKTGKILRQLKTKEGLLNSKFIPWWGGANIRDSLRCRTVALELKGDLDGAWSAYYAFYLPGSFEETWLRCRIEYVKAISCGRDDWSSYLPEFISLCELSTKAASHLSVDEALASIKKATTRFEEATGRWGRSSSYDLPGILMTDLDYGQVLELYRFRDNCAKIVNPKLHYLYGEDGKALVFLTRKSYAVFLTFMEERCAEYIKDCEKNSKPLPDSVEIGMNFLRRVAELPY